MKWLILFLLMFPIKGFSQKKEKPISDHFPTGNLDITKDDNKPANRPDRKNIRLLYVPNADKILYGNPCATEATHGMGFEYIVEPRNGLESKKSLGKFLNNLWIKTKLVATRSPFWKMILNNKIKKCRRQSGDFVG